MGIDHYVKKLELQERKIPHWHGVAWLPDSFDVEKLFSKSIDELDQDELDKIAETYQLLVDDNNYITK